MTDREPIQLPLPIDGMTVEIPLTKGYVAIVDAIDADLAGFKWIANVSPTNVYGLRFEWIVETQKQSGVIMHRVILSRMVGRDLKTKEQVDHRDGNGLNNRRANLRIATHSQNMRNRKISVRNTSGYKGVSFKKDIKKWQAHITVNNKLIYLGCYISPEKAHEAYCEAAEKYHGRFARFE